MRGGLRDGDRAVRVLLCQERVRADLVLVREHPEAELGRAQAAVGVGRQRGEVAPDVARVPGLVLIHEREEDDLGRDVALDLDQEVDEDLRRARHARLGGVHEGAREVVLLGL